MLAVSSYLMAGGADRSTKDSNPEEAFQVLYSQVASLLMIASKPDYIERPLSILTIVLPRPIVFTARFPGNLQLEALYAEYQVPSNAH